MIRKIRRKERYLSNKQLEAAKEKASKDQQPQSNDQVKKEDNQAAK